MIDKLPKRMIGLWDGMELHPFLVQLDDCLTKDGFMFVEHDIEAGCSIWSKELFPEHEFEVCIWPERNMGRGNYGFTATISVSSKAQAKIEQELGISNCYSSSDKRMNDFPIQSKSVCVLSLSFNWLISTWAPSAGSFSNSFSRWKSLPSSQYSSHAQDFLDRFNEQGRSLIQQLNSPEKLACILSNIESFPGAANGVGPKSASPNEYALVLHANSGHLDEAVKQAGIFEQRALKRLLLGSSYDEADVTAAKCATRKYLRWISDLNIGKPGTPSI
jgi:hypothetical protein